MRKIIFQITVSIDGLFEGPNKEIDWHNVDDEFNEFAIDLLNKVDVLLFGRKTYQLMESYWPTKEVIKNDPTIAERMNNLPKIVFSKTLDKVEWNNVTLIKENIAEEVTKLKQQPGEHIAVLGSSDLAVTLIERKLIDEFRIIISPVILGKGKQLFEGLKDKLSLRLLRAKTLHSGNVLFYYECKN
jgi:dihydrofolate reductase